MTDRAAIDARAALEAAGYRPGADTAALTREQRVAVTAALLALASLGEPVSPPVRSQPTTRRRRRKE